MLDKGESVLFARLAVFSGGTTLEAIEAVCDAEGDLPMDLLEGVSSLLDKSLLRQEEGLEGEPRFEMLETIHEFALEKIEQSGDAEAIKRVHAEYFLGLAEEAEPRLWGPEDAAWLNRLEQEYDNMRVALAWTIEHDEIEFALKLGGALRWFWYMEGYYGEGRRWLEKALANAALAPAEAKVKVLDGVGWLAYAQSDLDRMKAAAEEGLKLGEQAGLGSATMANFYNILGEMKRHQGDFEQAEKMLEESLAFYRTVDNRRGIAWALGSLANVSGDRGNYGRAKELYEEGLALSRALGGARPLGEYLISLGYEYLLEGNHVRATELNKEAAELYQRRGSKGGLQYAFDHLGWAALARGDHGQAEALHKNNLVLCRDLGDKLIASESIEGLACSEGATGEAERAAKLFGAAKAQREAVGYLHTPREHALREPYLAAAHSRVGDAAWAGAWEEGHSMTFEDAIAFALEEGASSRPGS
jgi:tetratricopeptide (TPR) repeat protein